MFFGYRQGLTTPLHELAGLLFTAASLLHIAVNIKPMRTHLRKPLGATLGLGFLALSVAALMPAGHTSKPNPRHVLGQTMDLLLSASFREAAALTHQPETELARRLAQAGMPISDTSMSLRDIAHANRKEPMELLAALLPNAGHRPR